MAYVTSQIYIPGDKETLLEKVKAVLESTSFLDQKRRVITFKATKIDRRPNPQKTREKYFAEWKDILVFQDDGWLKLLLNEQLTISILPDQAKAFHLYQKFGIDPQFTDKVTRSRPDINLSSSLARYFSSPVVHFTMFDSGSSEQYEAILLFQGKIIDYKYYYLFGDEPRSTDNLNDFSKWEKYYPSASKWRELESSKLERELFLQRNPPQSRMLDCLGITGIDVDEDNPAAVLEINLSKKESAASIKLTKESRATLGGWLFAASILLAALIGIYLLADWLTTILVVLIGMILWYIERRREKKKATL